MFSAFGNIFNFEIGKKAELNEDIKVHRVPFDLIWADGRQRFL